MDWVRREGDQCMLDVDTTLYSTGAVMRSCYRFTDRLYVFISNLEGGLLRVQVAAKDGGDTMTAAGELSNAFLDEQLRIDIAAETRALREVIYLQAFAEGDFEAGSR
jgi:His-Xaa-Ser system protein HxsD